VSDDDLSVGDRVTLSWYQPGEPYRPRGTVVEPAAEDLARLDGEAADRLLVLWKGTRAPNRRWERRADLHLDPTADDPGPT